MEESDFFFSRDKTNFYLTVLKGACAKESALLAVKTRKQNKVRGFVRFILVSTCMERGEGISLLQTPRVVACVSL